MEAEIEEFIFILEGLVDEVPFKAKVEIEVVIDMLKKPLDQEGLIKVSEQLEMISNMSNLDSFARNEIFNILSSLEGLL